MYSKEQIIEMFGVDRPYQKDCVNYKGKATKDGDNPSEYYSEILAKRILDCRDFDVIPYKPDRESFLFHTLSELCPKTNPSLASEKGLCRYWCTPGIGFEKEIQERLGVPIDYETNIVAGLKVNVDMLSLKAEGNKAILYLIEVKGRIPSGGSCYTTDETILRCALEIETYYQSITIEKEKKAKFIRDFRKKYPEVAGDIELKKAILVPAGSFAASQCDPKLFPKLNELLKKWEIEVVIYDNSPRKY